MKKSKSPPPKKHLVTLTPQKPANDPARHLRLNSRVTVLACLRYGSPLKFVCKCVQNIFGDLVEVKTTAGMQGIIDFWDKRTSGSCPRITLIRELLTDINSLLTTNIRISDTDKLALFVVRERVSCAVTELALLKKEDGFRNRLNGYLTEWFSDLLEVSAIHEAMRKQGITRMGAYKNLPSVRRDMRVAKNRKKKLGAP